MQLRATLSDEHRELDQLAQRMLAFVSADVPDEKLPRVRWRLNHLLTVHLAKEDKHLYPRLQRSGDHAARDTATRFAEEMGGLGQAYQAYANTWSHQAVAVDWQGFRRDTREVMKLLRRRIQREERDLYHYIDAA